MNKGRGSRQVIMALMKWATRVWHW